MKTNELFNYFGVNNYKELNENAEFKQKVLNICKIRGEEFFAWKSYRGSDNLSVYGIHIISNKGMASFVFDEQKGDFTCFCDALIYQFT